MFVFSHEVDTLIQRIFVSNIFNMCECEQKCVCVWDFESSLFSKVNVFVSCGKWNYFWAKVFKVYISCKGFWAHEGLIFELWFLSKVYSSRVYLSRRHKVKVFEWKVVKQTLFWLIHFLPLNWWLLKGEDFVKGPLDWTCFWTWFVD